MSIAYFSFSGFIALLFIIFVVLAHKFQYRDEQEAYSSFLDDDGAADERCYFNLSLALTGTQVISLQLWDSGAWRLLRPQGIWATL